MYLLRRLTNITSTVCSPSRIKFEKRGFAKVQFRQSQKQLQQLVREDQQYIQKQMGMILGIFPNVKGTLNNMFNNLSTNLDPSYKCHHTTLAVGRVSNQLVYHTTFTINWPKSKSFTGYGLKKRDAELNAMIKALEYLYNESLVTSSGHPVTVSHEEKQKLLDEWSRPPVLTVPYHLMEEGWKILDNFEEEVQPYLEEKNRSTSFIPMSHQEDSEDEMPSTGSFEPVSDNSDVDEEPGGSGFVLDLLTGKEYVVNPDASHSRSRELLERLSWRASSPTAQSRLGKTLPMLDYKDNLEKALDLHQVVIVAGDTGCGKSTQVPQMILDKWIKEERGADCNILISQPRRISAISLAKCIAQERGEQLGESIGYHVRLNYKRVEDRGGVMFLTTGMLLQGLHSNPTLEGISHVIVDEVHERSVPTDLLLILLRRLIHSNNNLKLVLMSASLSTEELRNYFGKSDSALIEVPGALYPLTRHYLLDVFSELNLNSKKYQLQPLTEPGSHPVVNVDLVLDIIKAIDSSRPPGAILCFLPGWQDINLVQVRLQENEKLKDRLWVLPLHSRLPSSEQEQIFEPAPSGMRKVVLATNIAETSLTVKDVVYVVDTGCHKEQRYDSRRDLSVLGNHWISKANGQQRAGRAGRVQPGEVFHLYSENIHKDMSRFPVPEILRISLEHVILQCKAHCGEESALSFLSDALSVPSPRLIGKAVRNLEDLGLLKSNRAESVETLTPLGRRVVHFSTPPHLSKALIYASIFKCIDSVASIAAALSSGRGIFHNSIDMRSGIRDIKQSVNPTSDLLAMLGLIQHWEELSNYRDSIHYCNNNNLSHRGLLFNNGIKRVYGDHLKDAFMVDNNVFSEDSTWNVNNLNHQLLLGVLLAGVNRVLLLQRGMLSKGILRKDSTIIKTLEGTVINTGSDCVLHSIPKNLDDDSRHLLCVHLTRDETSRRTVARDLSLLQPITVALFAGRAISLHLAGEQYLLSVDGQLKMSFHVDQRTGNFLIELRNAVRQLVEIIIETRGLDVPSSSFEASCDTLIQYVSRLVEYYDFKEEKNTKRSILYDDDDD